MKIFILWLKSLAWGLFLGTTFTLILYFFNIANLNHLIKTSHFPLLVLLMLAIPFSILFGGVQFAYTIFSLSKKDP